MEDLQLEYQVRPVTRFIVTGFHRSSSDPRQMGSSQHGEFDNADTAYAVAYALCKQEHERLGYSIDDDRVRYPRHPNEIRAQDIGAPFPDEG